MLGCLVLCAFASDDSYTITTVERLVPPYSLAAMNDEFQSATLLKESGGVATFRVTFRPLHRQTVHADPNWRRDDAGMTEYLRPRPAANWDAALKAELFAELKAAGIDPDRLDDVTVVRRVAAWAMRRSTFNDQFGLWMVRFRSGKPEIVPELAHAFADNEPKGTSQSEIFGRELFGKGMFEHKTHGACTSSATYLATILRAVGIPTRIILTVPAADTNDPAQVARLLRAVRQNRLRHEIAMGMSTPQSADFTNHVYNEVWVGHTWVRLNYDRLAQPIVDRDYLGLMLHVYTANDFSDVPYASTWGARYALGKGPKLSSINPVELVSASDHVSDPKTFVNPPYPELHVRTITGIYFRGAPELSGLVPESSSIEAWLRVKEWLPELDYHQLADFLREAPTRLTLRSPGHRDVSVTITRNTANTGAEPGGRVILYGLELDPAPDAGTSYAIIVPASQKRNRWVVMPGITVRTPEATQR